MNDKNHVAESTASLEPAEILASLYRERPARWGSDEITTGILERIGIGEGWHCLEVGAGTGSIAEWCCRRVGRTGLVTATDVELRFLNALKHANLRVMKHDIVKDRLPEAEFDLVHARCVLLLFEQREEALRKMANAVRPGGWLVAEEPDFITEAPDPLAAKPLISLYEKGARALMSSRADRGMGLRFGSRLFGLLRSFGFESVQCDSHARTVRGATPESAFFKRLAAQFRKPVLAAGELSEQEFDRFLSLHDDAGFAWRSPLTVSAWGRRPARAR